jgi:nucleoside-diphosphate-sugar epimerase
VARNKEWRVKVLVTGAAGYLGCRLVRKLADRGDYVTAVDRFYFGRDGLPQHPGLTWVERDAARSIASRSAVSMPSSPWQRQARMPQRRLFLPRR